MGWPGPTRAREARLHKWASPFITGSQIRGPDPACVGHGPARPVYFILLKFIHSFLCIFNHSPLFFLLKYDWMGIKL